MRTVSRAVSEWIGRLGAIWIDGQVAEFRPRPGARVLYLTLRDSPDERVQQQLETLLEAVPWSKG